MILNLLGAIFLTLCIFAGIKDMRSLIIPNWLNLAIVILFLPAAFLAGLSLEAFGWHIAIAAIALVIGFTLFAFGVFGGGDAKMIPAVLLWMGPDAAIEFSFTMALAGGVLAVFVLFAKKLTPYWNVPAALQGALEEEGGVPYAIAITVGVMMAAPSSPLLATLLSNFSGLN